MAIALRGTPTTSRLGHSGTLTISVPSGVVSGDVLVIKCLVGGTTLPATPSGLTLVDSASTGPSYATYVRVCDGTETSFSFTVSSSASATCRAYSGVDNSNPVNVHSVHRTSTSTTATATTITTTLPDCVLVFGSGIGSAESSFTNPTGFANQSASLSSPAVVSCDETQAAAGATGSISGTWASTANNNYASLIALAPAATGSTFNDSGSGTIVLGGSSSESASTSVIATGTVILSGSGVENFQLGSISHTDVGSGTIFLSGSRIESSLHSQSSAGTIILGGSRTESSMHAESGSGNMQMLGSRVESAIHVGGSTGVIVFTGSGMEGSTQPDIYVAPLDHRTIDRDIHI